MSKFNNMWVYIDDTNKQTLRGSTEGLVKAQELAKENILWEGYISDNKARIEIMKYLIGKGIGNVNDLQNGMYIVNVIDNNGEVSTSKVSVLH